MSVVGAFVGAVVTLAFVSSAESEPLQQSATANSATPKKSFFVTLGRLEVMEITTLQRDGRKANFMR
jgi:hypothetical protein